LRYPASGRSELCSQTICQGGSFALESVAAFVWNGWQACAGISGRLGVEYARKASIILMMSSQGAVVILFQWMAGQEHLLYLGATIIGFNFGGNFALFPTVTADTFGSKYIGQNYGWVFLAYGLGGIIGPVLGGKLGDLNNYPLAFTICGALCFVAVGIIGALEKPAKP